MQTIENFSGASRGNSKIRSLVLCSLFAALTAVGAFIRVPLPLADYFTLQTLFVMLAGMLLGSKLGATAMGVYVLIGLSGLPVFAAGGGPTYVLRPSFGFLLSFILAAWLIGRLTERQINLNFGGWLLAGFIGLVVIYSGGLVYKYIILNDYLGTPISLWLLFLACLPVDIPGDLVLCLGAAYLARRLKPLLRRQGF